MLNKIKKAIRSIEQGKQNTDVLEYFTRLKSEIAGKLDKGDYGTNVQIYDKLGQLEHSMYRYNELTKAGLTEDAAKEGWNFINISQSPDGAIMLKGGISNTRYVWHTEDGACEACQALDGREFETLDEVPERPHPNCKCQVLPVNEKGEEYLKELPYWAKVQLDAIKILGELALRAPSIEYYQGAVSGAESLSYPYRKNEVLVLKNLPDQNMKNFVKSKYDIKDDTPVVVPGKHSKLYQEVINSPELKNLLKQNLRSIVFDRVPENNLSERYSGFQDLHFVIGKFNFYNPHVDYSGNIRGFLVDYYDFTRMLDGNFLLKEINNNAYIQQEYGYLENYVIIIPIEIKLKELLYE